jgi:ribose 5-phosphate isomerase B
VTGFAVAADHNGVALKERVIAWLVEHGHAATDLGTHGTEVVDYPALCVAVGTAVTSGAADYGIMIGGSGMGEVVALNKLVGIRAGLAFSPFAVEISRGNNDANVVVLGAKLYGADEAIDLLERWIATPFKGGEHARRVAQIAALEAGPSVRPG